VRGGRGAKRQLVLCLTISLHRRALLGSAVNFSGPLEYIEYQIKELANEEPDAFIVTGCEGEEKRQELQEILTRNKKRMVNKWTVSTTGITIFDERETEIGFDIPAVLVRSENDEIVIEDIF